MSDQEHLYEVDISWKQGRIGSMTSPKLNQEIEVATPPEFPGGVEGIWSPEHLFVSSVASCFMTTFLAIAEYSKLEFENLRINAIGKLGKAEDGKVMVTEIILKPDLAITDEKFTDKAKRIMQKADAACIISRSIKSKIILESKVSVGALN
jgi:peroxiredoxin-like protein